MPLDAFYRFLRPREKKIGGQTRRRKNEREFILFSRGLTEAHFNINVHKSCSLEVFSIFDIPHRTNSLTKIYVDFLPPKM